MHSILHPPVVVSSDMNGPGDKCSGSGSLFVFYNDAVTPIMCPGHGTLRHNINSGQGGPSTGSRFLQASETRDSPVAIVTVTQAPGRSPEDAPLLTT